ncbi:MAG: DUF4351 domain-containing protein, partial [Pseudomonadota bacterium]
VHHFQEVKIRLLTWVRLEKTDDGFEAGGHDFDPERPQEDADCGSNQNDDFSWLDEDANIAPIVRKVQAHHESQPSGGIDWMELLETVLVYRLPACTREEIQQMLNFNDVSLKQTRFYQDVFAEGLVEGKAEGRVEGKAEGRVEGEATLLLRLLERKFHLLPESARQRIAAADAETLLVWGERVLDAKSLDEVWGS